MSRAAQDMAVVLAAHGDRGGEDANAALLAHRDVVATSQRFRSVTAGVLKGDPPLEAALAAAAASGARHIVIYPYFMADGFFVNTRLRQRIEAAALALPWHLLPPLGLDEDLPDLMRRSAGSTAQAAHFAHAAADLLVVGHGSKLGPASSDATRVVAAHLTRIAGFRSVHTAFLEEPPSLQTALQSAHEPIVVSGFFSGDGLHAGEDVPQAIAASRRRAVYAGPIGRDPAVADLILKRLLQYAGACDAT